MTDDELHKLCSKYKKAVINNDEDLKDQIFEIFRFMYSKAINKYSHFGEDQKQDCHLSIHESLLKYNKHYHIQPLTKVLFFGVKWAGLQGLNAIVGYNYSQALRFDKIPKFISINKGDPQAEDIKNIMPPDPTPSALDQLIAAEETLPIISPMLHEWLIDNLTAMQMSKSGKYTKESKHKNPYMHSHQVRYIILKELKTNHISNKDRIKYKNKTNVSPITKAWIDGQSVNQIVLSNTFFNPKFKGLIRNLRQEEILAVLLNEINTIKAANSEPPINYIIDLPTFRANKRVKQSEWQRNHKDKIHEYYIKNKNKPYYLKNLAKQKAKSKQITYGKNQ